jgi:DNA-binding NarL/FixJ family response regulator
MHNRIFPRANWHILERATRIELAFSAWEADVLPLNYARGMVNHTVAPRNDSSTLARLSCLVPTSEDRDTRWYFQSMVIRVVLAEDNALLREGIARMVGADADFDLVGVASDYPELIELIGVHEPDVVITDIRMPPTGTDEGIRAANWVRENHPTVGVVVLSQYTAPSYALALLEEGSAGRAYLLKERVAGADELSRAIRVVAEGGSVIDPLVVDELVKARSKRPKTDLDWLTPRETEILSEMAQGKSNGAIAKTLGVSERAVEKHSNSIFAKFGLSEEHDLNRRVKAVLVYLGEAPGS